MWQALRGITLAPRLRFLRVSSLYRTEPWGVTDQPAFTNAVIEADTTLEPLALLDHLQHVERDMGRIRTGRRWGPRLIDLDVLLCGEGQLDSPRLIIPPPDAPTRIRHGAFGGTGSRPPRTRSRQGHGYPGGPGLRCRVPSGYHFDGAGS